MIVNKNKYIITSTVVLVLVLLSISCKETEVPIEDPGIAALSTLEGEIVDPITWIESEKIMAYVLSDDDHIYVAEQYMADVQKELDATVTDDIWEYKNTKGILQKRARRPLEKTHNLSKVSIVKWAFAKGYQCQEKEKGYLLPIHRVGDRNRKPIAAYRTTEKGKWCIDNKYATCKFGWKNVTDKFIKVRNGKLIKRRGKYVLSKKTTIPIMVCVD